MTYDPNRNDPPDDSYLEYRNEDRAAAGAAVLLLAAIGGFIYFYAVPSDRSVATTDLRPPITQLSTTGSTPAPEATGASAK